MINDSLQCNCDAPFTGVDHNSELILEQSKKISSLEKLLRLALLRMRQASITLDEPLLTWLIEAEKKDLDSKESLKDALKRFREASNQHEDRNP